VAGREQVARREVGAGAVVEGAGGGGGVGHAGGLMCEGCGSRVRSGATVSRQQNSTRP